MGAARGAAPLSLPLAKTGVSEPNLLAAWDAAVESSWPWDAQGRTRDCFGREPLRHPSVQAVIVLLALGKTANPLFRRRFTRRASRAPSSHHSSSRQYIHVTRPSLEKRPPRWLRWDCHACLRAVKIPDARGPRSFRLTIIEMTDSELAAPRCASRSVWRYRE
jgi:hypothetical protein